jgi:protein gp37
MKNSAIEWTDHTFNPWIGCTKVAPECKFCYAEEQQDHRYHRVKWGKAHPRHRTSTAYWKQPLSWNAMPSAYRQRVFCASLADVFDEEVKNEWRDDLFDLIEKTRNLDWLILTKRPDAVGTYLRGRFLPENIWLGVSAGVNPIRAFTTKASIHFLSCEPMLHPMIASEGFDWIIFGGESGTSARFCDPDWIRDGLRFCASANIAPFVKQLGSNCGLRLLDHKGGDINEWPEDLRVRKFPR